MKFAFLELDGVLIKTQVVRGSKGKWVVGLAVIQKPVTETTFYPDYDYSSDDLYHAVSGLRTYCLKLQSVGLSSLLYML